jgi:hypothetical protein
VLIQEHLAKPYQEGQPPQRAKWQHPPGENALRDGRGEEGSMIYPSPGPHFRAIVGPLRR